MRTPKQWLKDWLGISRIEDKLWPPLTAVQIDGTLNNTALTSRLGGTTVTTAVIGKDTVEKIEKIVKGYES